MIKMVDTYLPCGNREATDQLHLRRLIALKINHRMSMAHVPIYSGLQLAHLMNFSY
jgi:hypothetical protein